VSDPMQPYGPPANSGMKTALAAGAILALIVANVYLFLQLDQVRTEMVQNREAILTELTNLKETSSVSSASARRNLDTLKEELTAARQHANTVAGQAKTEALTRAEQLARRLAEEQQQQRQQLSSEIGEVKQAATTANTRLGEVSGDVTSVRSEIASTKSELEKTIGDLKKVTGDLGVQSGYIATNGKEIAALRRLGERNIIEFNLGKTKQPQRVGDISIMLKRADPKRNRYTIEVLADDKKTEKKDKNVNEPLQFYTLKARQPYELVVNEVKKDQIVGYLSTPKEQVARN
jgi:chromosome segregation ATPase